MDEPGSTTAWAEAHFGSAALGDRRRTRRLVRAAGLLSYARTLPGAAEDRVDIPSRGGRPARAAAVRLASAPVWVPAPVHTPQRSR
jgi:hypothetical protein